MNRPAINGWKRPNRSYYTVQSSPLKSREAEYDVQDHTASRMGAGTRI